MSVYARRCTACLCRVKSSCCDRRNGVSFIVHRNGDTFNPGRRVFINQRLALTWSSFMEQVRKQLGQYVPAIRCIVSPNTGTKIESVGDIMENHRYVAVPRGEPLKLLDYQKTDERSRYASNHHTSSELFEKYWRKRHIRLKSQVGRLSDGFRRNVKVIFVYRNGDTFTPAIRVHLRPIQAMDFELIMRAIEDCVILPYGKAVRRLYTLGGELVKSPEMVKDHHFYVAAGSETYLSRDYGQPLPRLITASRKPNSNMSSTHSNRSTPISRTPITVTNTNTSTITTTTTTTTPYSYQHPNYLDKESLAATKIQAGYRGYCTRKKYGNLSLNSSSPSSNYNVTSNRQLYTTYQSPLRNNNDLENAATRIQASYRGYLTRKSLRDDNITQKYTPIKNVSYHYDKINRINKNENDNDDDDIDGKVKAVTKIQAGYRGYKTRKSLAPLLHSQQNLLLSNKENQNYLEYKCINQDKQNNHHHHLHDLYNPELAAIKIQATYRGYRTRRQLPK